VCLYAIDARDLSNIVRTLNNVINGSIILIKTIEITTKDLRGLIAVQTNISRTMRELEFTAMQHNMNWYSCKKDEEPTPPAGFRQC
jgi:hypothetical protein